MKISKAAWADHLNKWEISPVWRQPFEGVDLLVAEGERSQLSPKVAADEMLDQQNLRNMGPYYKVVWAIDYDDHIDIGGAVFFEKGHDPHLTEDVKQTARIETALRQASAWLLAERETVH